VVLKVGDQRARLGACSSPALRQVYDPRRHGGVSLYFDGSAISAPADSVGSIRVRPVVEQVGKLDLPEISTGGDELVLEPSDLYIIGDDQPGG